jgi:L-amino acid N-acyltransferase
MRIRPARPGDAAAIAALWNAMIRDTLFTFTTLEKTVPGIAALIAEREGAFWVADLHGAQGFVTFGPFRAGPGYAATVEHTVILGPGVRGQGAGRALMSQALAGAAVQGRHVMVAGISSANPGAQTFHARMGFERTGYMPQVARKGGQWLDLVLMQKTVGAT